MCTLALTVLVTPRWRLPGGWPETPHKVRTYVDKAKTLISTNDKTRVSRPAGAMHWWPIACRSLSAGGPLSAVR